MSADPSEIRSDDYRRKRHHSDRDIPDITEISDPDKRADETRKSLGEKIKENKWFVLASGFFIMIFGVLMIIYGARYVPRLLANPIFQAFAKYGTVFGLAYTIGWKNHQNKRDNMDWLVLMTKDDVIRLFGNYEDGKFEPIKGFKWLGHGKEYYKLKDLSPEITQTLAGLNRDLDDRVKIGLHPSMSDMTQTEMGTVVAQLSPGLKPDPWGRETNVVAELPEMADKNRLRDMKEELENVYEEYKEADKRADMFKKQRDNALEEAEMTRDQVIDEFVQRYSKVKSAESGQAHQPPRGGAGVGMQDDQLEESLQ